MNVIVIRSPRRVHHSPHLPMVLHRLMVALVVAAQAPQDQVVGASSVAPGVAYEGDPGENFENCPCLNVNLSALPPGGWMLTNNANGTCNKGSWQDVTRTYGMLGCRAYDEVEHPGCQGDVIPEWVHVSESNLPKAYIRPCARCLLNGPASSCAVYS